MGRRAMTATTMTVLILTLLVAGFIGWRTISQPVDEDADTGRSAAREPTCDPGLDKGDVVRTREVTVSVFNAGSRAGLAAQTLEELAARKFIPGDIANAPQAFVDVRFVRVLAPTLDDPAARLVALQFGRETLIETTKADLGPGVDVVVGNEFMGLVKGPARVRATAAGSGC